MDDLSIKLTTAFLSDPRLGLYRKKYPQIEKLAAQMEQTHDRRYISLIMTEINKEKTEFQKSFHHYIIPLLFMVFADRNIPKSFWKALYYHCCAGLDIQLLRALMALKNYLENLTEPVQIPQLQEKYLQNFRYRATAQEQEVFEQLNGKYLSVQKLPPELEK